MDFPKWATLQRRAKLVELFEDSRGFCVYHHDPCPDIAKDCYQAFAEREIEWWKEDDREERSVQLKLERRALHALPKITRRGQFDSIAREIFLGQRPLYEVKGVGVGAFTHKRTAKVVVPGLLKAELWVDLGDVKAASKNSKRKFARYKVGTAPQSIETQISDRCRAAAMAYMEKIP